MVMPPDFKPPIFPEEKKEIIIKDEDGNINLIKTVINIVGRIISFPMTIPVVRSDKSDK